jgi:hypothetical protein
MKASHQPNLDSNVMLIEVNYEISSYDSKIKLGNWSIDAVITICP